MHLSCGFIESEIARKDNHGRLREDKESKAPKALVVPVAKAVGEILAAVEKKRGDVAVTGHGRAFVAATRLYPDFNRLIEKAMKL